VTALCSAHVAEGISKGLQKKEWKWLRSKGHYSAYLNVASKTHCSMTKLKKTKVILKCKNK
jgi:hypothetical protein